MSASPEAGGTGDSVRKRKGGQKNDKKGKSETTEVVEDNTETSHNQAPAGSEQQQEQQPQEPVPEVLYIPSNRIVLAVPKCLCYSVVAVFAVCFIILGGVIGDMVWRNFVYKAVPDPDFDPYPAITAAIGKEGVNFFNQHDRDNDGYLSLEEFEVIFHTLNGTGINVSIIMLEF